MRRGGQSGFGGEYRCGTTERMAAEGPECSQRWRDPATKRRGETQKQDGGSWIVELGRSGQGSTSTMATIRNQ